MSIVLYGIPLSPFVRKVDVFLREKGIPFESDNVSIMPVPEWFKEISPAKRIPVLRDTEIGSDGVLGTIPDSSAICAYLERKFPVPALYPEEAYPYARAVWLEEYCDTELSMLIGLGIFRPIQFKRFVGEEPDLQTARETYNEKLPAKLDYLESEIGEREFFVGDTLSIADVSVACTVGQMELVAGPLDDSRWPGVAGLVSRLTQRESFAPALKVCRQIVTQDPIDLRVS